MHIERIYPDEQLWESAVSTSHQFFTNAVLPEMIGKFFSRVEEPSILETNRDSSVTASTPGLELYCYCQRPERAEDGAMVGCDDKSCVKRWFHLTCLNLKCAPKTTTWYCPECRKTNRKKGTYIY